MQVNTLLLYGFVIVVSVFFASLYDREVRALNSLNTINGRRTFGQYPPRIRLLLLLTALPLTLLSVFRNGVGVDVNYAYLPDFNNLVVGGYAHSDVGFQLINRVIILFHGSYQFVVATSAIIFLYGTFSLASIFADNLLMMTIILIMSFNYFASFSLIAQFSAIGFLCLSLKYAFIHMPVPSLIFVAIAGSMHSSALIFLPVLLALWLIEKSNRPFAMIGLMSAAVIIVAMFSQFLVTHFLGGTRFGVYLSNPDNQSSLESLSSTSMIIMNWAILFFMFILLVYSPNMKNDPITCFFLLLQIFAAVFSLLQGQIILMVRVLYYFNFFQYISIPFFTYKLQFKLPIRAAIVLAFTSWCLIYPVSGNYYEISPYQSIFG